MDEPKPGNSPEGGFAPTEPGWNTSDYRYDLPEKLIAQTPSAERDRSRMMVLHRLTGTIEHRFFYDLIDYLNPGDVLVINESAVIPARLLGKREATGARMEILLLRRLEGDRINGNRIDCERWETLVRPGRRARTGEWLTFGNGELRAQIESAGDDGVRTIRFAYEYDGSFYALLDALGEMPLPPYIHQKPDDPSRYQTVYANNDQKGSAAAPTAGLHFTPDLLRLIEARGVSVERILLHVGLGTFRPVGVADIRRHRMHAEYYELSARTAETVNRAKDRGNRVVAVGTTSVRVLECAANVHGRVSASSGWTDIFIHPGVAFRIVDALVTNFHLPESTLLMLVSAFAGRDTVLSAYRTAVEEGYRFFSFGDAMLLCD
jgi:S-adenosylmethionine:tRNA ribosyltransferase-isomerase